MSIKGQLTISRPSYSGERKSISIKVKDSTAGVNFLDIEIPLDNFAECLTGLAAVDCSIEVRGLENVGKTIKRENLVFEMPASIKYSERKSAAFDLAKLAAPAGWVVRDYFDSQDSFFTKDGKDYAQTQMMRWV